MARLKAPPAAAASASTTTKLPTASGKEIHSDSDSSSSSESNESVNASVSTKEVGFDRIFESPILEYGRSDDCDFSDSNYSYFNGKIIRSFDSICEDDIDEVADTDWEVVDATKVSTEDSNHNCVNSSDGGKSNSCISCSNISTEDSNHNCVNSSGCGKSVKFFDRFKSSTEDSNHNCINSSGDGKSSKVKRSSRTSSRDSNQNCVNSSGDGSYGFGIAMASTKESNTSCFDSSSHEVIIVDSLESINVPTISAKDSYHSSVNSSNKKSKGKKKKSSVSTRDSFHKGVNRSNSRNFGISSTKESDSSHLNGRNTFPDDDGGGQNIVDGFARSRDRFKITVNRNKHVITKTSSKDSSSKNVDSDSFVATNSSSKDSSLKNVDRCNSDRKSSSGVQLNQQLFKSSRQKNQKKQSRLISPTAADISVLDNESLRKFNEKVDAIDSGFHSKSNNNLSISSNSNSKPRKFILKLSFKKKKKDIAPSNSNKKETEQLPTETIVTTKAVSPSRPLKSNLKPKEVKDKTVIKETEKAVTTLRKKAYVKTTLCELYMMIQVKVGCIVIKNQEELILKRVFNKCECNGTIYKGVFLQLKSCNCKEKFERFIIVSHPLMKFCSKLYKQKNLTTFASGETQKILNLVTEEELKEFECRYRKKVNILDDSKVHRPPTVVQNPETFVFSLSDSGDDCNGLDIDNIPLQPLDEKPSSDIENSNHLELKKKMKNETRLKKPEPNSHGMKSHGKGGRGRGRGRLPRDQNQRGGRGGRGPGSGGRNGGRFNNNYNPNNCNNRSNWNDNSSYNRPHDGYNQNHDRSVAFNPQNRYYDDYQNNHNGYDDYTSYNGGEFHNDGFNGQYHPSALKRNDPTPENNATFSLAFDGVIKTVRLINMNDIVKLNNDEFYKMGNKLFKLTLNENLFIESSSGNKYVDVTNLIQIGNNQSNTIRVPDSVSHVSTIGTNVSIPAAPKRKKAKVMEVSEKKKWPFRGRKKSTLFKRLLKYNVVTEKWRNPISVLDKGSLDDPIMFFYQSCHNKTGCYKDDVSKYTLDDLEWTFLVGNKARVFDSDLILECHSGKTPIVDIFSEEERNEFRSAKDALNKLEDMRCFKNDASM